MSDRILRALMQLFAIISNADRLTGYGRAIVENFLRKQISLSLVHGYLEIFDENLNYLQGKSTAGKQRKRVSVNSVKVLRICTEINGELDQRQKYIVLIRLIEFAHSAGDSIDEQEKEFLATVANVFNINDVDFEACILLAGTCNKTSIENNRSFLIISSPKEQANHAGHLTNEGLDGEIYLLYLKQSGLLLSRYTGNSKLTLNGLPMNASSVYVFSSGSVIRGQKSQPVYYSDVHRYFLSDTSKSEFIFSVENIEYNFASGRKGLNTITFSAASGNLAGIMGGSGTGKSTLLNILNGNLKPSKGKVFVNEINLHDELKKTGGIIGFVPQDDLLIEDLSVYQNIFYNTKLCFGDLSDNEIKLNVNKLLESLGLFEIKDLKVGSVLNKTISGGQRKRLNIALELIRSPLILFIDEPTSGLSSLDSENVMDLVKQLTINGTLVFVVIHQPSSEIFKLFDKLLILDSGGFPIFYGSPIDSLTYFKVNANYADADESECERCGNINPEQIFSIIESKTIDEFGHPTPVRKFSPGYWFHLHLDQIKDRSQKIFTGKLNLQKRFSKPSRLQQLIVFLKRDVLSKIQNRQYLYINFFEAPALALILSFFLKYSPIGKEYVFRENVNIPAYIFIGIIVSLFMGLTLSAEEIIRDRKIIKREAFLNLSRSSYLVSKIIIMFFISAIQTLSFVWIGNSILGIKDLHFDYWVVLFSVACFSNLLGLNISAAFDSAVTIYILIPLLIIPQIILSGVMVKFEQMNPVVSSPGKVPGLGEIMASRWAFEALAVDQFKNNKYEKLFFEIEKRKSNATYKSSVWADKLNHKMDSIIAGKHGVDKEKQLGIIHSEINKDLPQLYLNYDLNPSHLKELKALIEERRNFYSRDYNYTEALNDSLVNVIGNNNLKKIKDDYSNESLRQLVLNDISDNRLVENQNGFVRLFQPVYMDAPENSLVRAPFFVSRKNVFGNYFETYSVNIFVIWLMTLALGCCLYFNVFRKLIRLTGINFLKKKRAVE